MLHGKWGIFTPEFDACTHYQLTVGTLLGSNKIMSPLALKINMSCTLLSIIPLCISSSNSLYCGNLTSYFLRYYHRLT